MNQLDKAKRFAQLHVKGSPLLLYNAWDAGSAKAVMSAGAKAVATSSWAVAAAQGYSDGEDAPVELVEEIVGRITAVVDGPVSVDFEGGYSEDEAGLSENVTRLVKLGVIGVNFEDRVVRGEGLYAIDRQAQRIAAIRTAAQQAGVPLFINARTDLFLGRGTPDPADSVAPALERALAYAAAGASGFFIPGLKDEALIGRISDGVDVPVNVMIMSGAPSVQRLSELGVARISWGNIPYVEAMAGLERGAKKIFG
ncbi:MAG: isocitrate lyase/phosphoenolpyruvate mutase family protein [Gammaproteobacteria bacterium]|jgi:2-methylisocitrate lyase-like PEP mutase family enzyme|nr:isocitrate lyase/phosphoenolpyruvate mutase family protein [Gammaproteobacteria bacterium]